MRTTAACLVVVSILLPGSVLAQQHRGSAEDQLACTPDVYRLCSQYIPDEDDIVACLQRKKAQLSAACNAVFSRPDSEPAKPQQPDDSD